MLPTVREKDVLLSGGFGTAVNSARAGFLPIALARAPIGAFEGIPVYLRSRPPGPDGPRPTAASAIAAAAAPMPADDHRDAFTLFSAEHVRFTEEHRTRLMERGIRFVYIPMALQSKFRGQTEARLNEIIEDPSVASSVKSEIIYETSVELINELLSEQDLAGMTPRIESVSRAVTTLVLNDPSSFNHLFAASHHDFYTATHMVNVATWMVPLAYELGYTNLDELNHICQAGILHDIGKVHVPAEILNKKGKLEPHEWEAIRKHPQLGFDYLTQCQGIHDLVRIVTLQHHERLDGSGYPFGLKGDQIHPVSKLCALVDSFDAMTAFRPFKDRTLSVADTMRILAKETPSKYDAKIMAAWVGLIDAAGRDAGVIASAPPGVAVADVDRRVGQRRRFPRFPINCPAKVHVMVRSGEAWAERPALPVVAHNISKCGVGFLSQVSLQVGDSIRIYMQGTGTLNRTDEGVVVRCRAYRDGWHDIGVNYAPLGSITETGPGAGTTGATGPKPPDASGPLRASA